MKKVTIGNTTYHVTDEEARRLKREVKKMLVYVRAGNGLFRVYAPIDATVTDIKKIMLDERNLIVANEVVLCEDDKVREFFPDTPLKKEETVLFLTATPASLDVAVKEIAEKLGYAMKQTTFTQRPGGAIDYHMTISWLNKETQS